MSYLFISEEKVLLFGGIPDHQAVFFNLKEEEIVVADNQFNIEGRFFLMIDVCRSGRANESAGRAYQRVLTH